MILTQIVQAKLHPIQVQLKKSAEKFRHIALGLLKECSLQSYETTKLALQQPNIRFGEMKALEVCWSTRVRQNTECLH